MHGVYVVKTSKNPKKDTCILYQLTYMHYCTPLMLTSALIIFTNYDKTNYVNNRFVMISIHL